MEHDLARWAWGSWSQAGRSSRQRCSGIFLIFLGPVTGWVCPPSRSSVVAFPQKPESETRKKGKKEGKREEEEGRWTFPQNDFQEPRYNLAKPSPASGRQREAQAEGGWRRALKPAEGKPSCRCLLPELNLGTLPFLPSLGLLQSVHLLSPDRTFLPGAFKPGPLFLGREWGGSLCRSPGSPGHLG